MGTEETTKFFAAALKCSGYLDEGGMLNESLFFKTVPSIIIVGQTVLNALGYTRFLLTSHKIDLVQLNFETLR